MGIRSSKSDPGLELPFPGQREPYLSKTQTEYVELIYAFLFRLRAELVLPGMLGFCSSLAGEYSQGSQPRKVLPQ